MDFPFQSSGKNQNDIHSVVKFLQRRLFLIFHLKSVSDGPLLDKPNYISLLKKLSNILKPLRLLLTSEGSVNKQVNMRGI